MSDLNSWNAKDAAKRKPTVEMYQPPPEVWALVPTFEEIRIVMKRLAQSGSDPFIN
jgi:hypothetical protein